MTSDTSPTRWSENQRSVTASDKPQNLIPPFSPSHAVQGEDKLPFVARLDNIGLCYGKTQALKGISLDIPAGQMIGLIGPDGVGKIKLVVPFGRSPFRSARWPAGLGRRHEQRAAS